MASAWRRLHRCRGSRHCADRDRRYYTAKDVICSCRVLFDDGAAGPCPCHGGNRRVLPWWSCGRCRLCSDGSDCRDVRYSAGLLASDWARCAPWRKCSIRRRGNDFHDRDHSHGFVCTSGDRGRVCALGPTSSPRPAAAMRPAAPVTVAVSARDTIARPRALFHAS
jgi:hypothetical protein